jgi:tetratricopeptide (TPR) repeat protein
MNETPATTTEFDTLRDLWQREIEAGHLEEAETLIRRSLAWAEAHGDPRQIDAAVCNLAAVGIHLGRGESEIPRLREILLRNSDPANCRLSAYNISIYYQFAKNYKKSVFYARIARDRSEQIGRRDWISSSHNQLGNALLGESLVEEACREYDKALSLMSLETSVWRAGVLDNLGYCRILQERYREGYALLYESLRMLRRMGSWRYEIMPRLDLCFAHLETGHYRYAWRHGAMALGLAERAGHQDAVKNALYLLGEAANLSGDSSAAHDYFARLQRDFFPDSAYLPGFLMAVDVRKLVNLHA